MYSFIYCIVCLTLKVKGHFEANVLASSVDLPLPTLLPTGASKHSLVSQSSVNTILSKPLVEKHMMSIAEPSSTLATFLHWLFTLQALPHWLGAEWAKGGGV